MLDCLIVPFLWNLSDPKGKSSFYAFIMNHKLLLYLYFFSLDDGLIADLKTGESSVVCEKLRKTQSLSLSVSLISVSIWDWDWGRV